jgi:ribosomal-protein-alanine N-acetyltransferase
MLRRPELSDGDEVIELNRQSKKLHRPWLYAPLDEESWTRYIERLESERHLGSLVCLKDTGAIVGVINMSEIAQGIFQSAYLGYYGGAEYAGQGYMTEGLSLLVSHAFNRLKLHRLEANIQPGNQRSLALVRRLGFRKEGFSARYLKIGGRWRDHERWAITSEDWRAAK